MKEHHPLRRWLFEQHETARAFCARSGIDPGYLSHVMRGEKRPTLPTIDKITAATNGAITANDFQAFHAKESAE